MKNMARSAQTRLTDAPIGPLVDAVRVTGRGLDLLVRADDLSLRDAAARTRQILTPPPRPPLRIERA